MRITAGDQDFLTDDQVEEVASQMVAVLGPAVATMMVAAGIDARDQVRFHAVAERCRARRESQGLSIPSAAGTMKVAQYRLKDIEAGGVGRMDARILARYVTLLGLDDWFARWKSHNAELAGRLGSGPGAQARSARPGRTKRVPGFRTALQFKIVLEDIEPPVWRRIQVPDIYTFWDLHVAIQDAMGWQDYHLHEFETVESATGATVRVGIPDGDFPDERPTRPGWQVPVASHFQAEGARASYLYDFGDGWRHAVTLEGSHPRDDGVRYPCCLDGARACPPEDVGGPRGYQEFLEAIADPDHEEHEHLLGWAGGGFDPERFVPGAVRFDDPRQRWKVAFGGR